MDALERMHWNGSVGMNALEWMLWNECIGVDALEWMHWNACIEIMIPKLEISPRSTKTINA